MIDEIGLHDGHQYSTHIIDGETGEMLWAQVGKKKSVVYDFIQHVGLEWMSHVQAVACDMNSDFQEAFLDKCPHIKIVFDHFRIIKHFNEDVLDNIRKNEVKRLLDEGKTEEAARFKRTKYLIMMNEEARAKRDAKAAAGKTTGKESPTFGLHEHRIRGNSQKRYEELIASNELLFAADAIKEKLTFAYGTFRTDDDEVAYNCASEGEMRACMLDIIALCEGTGNKHFLKFAKMISSHLDGIVTFATFHISNGKMEGINGRAKTPRRISYGISDDHYFFLKLFDMTRSKIRAKESTKEHTKLCKELGYRRASKRTIIVQESYKFVSDVA